MLQSNAVSHWLGANLESALFIITNLACDPSVGIPQWLHTCLSHERGLPRQQIPSRLQYEGVQGLCNAREISAAALRRTIAEEPE